MDFAYPRKKKSERRVRPAGVFCATWWFTLTWCCMPVWAGTGRWVEPAADTPALEHQPGPDGEPRPPTGAWARALVRSIAPAGRADLRPLLAALRDDASAGWRAEILLLGIDGAFPIEPRPRDTSAAIASDLRERWTRALDWLEGHDPTLAAEVATLVLGVVDFGPGGVLPAWPASLPEPQDLVDERLPAPRVLERVRAWLAGQVTSVAWVIDDAGSGPATGPLIGQIGVANLTSTPLVVSARAQASRPPELVPIAPRQVGTLDAPGTTTLLGLPQGETVLTTLGARLPVTPPGAVLGPGVRDWTMSAWMSGRGEALPGAPTLRVWRDDQPGAWVIEIRGTLSERGEGGIVRVFMGPRRERPGVLSITSDGTVVDETTGASTRVRCRHNEGEWTALVPVPAWALEPGPTLRIGWTYQLGDERASWPRAMPPGQGQPGRAALDLSAWDGLGG